MVREPIIRVVILYKTLATQDYNQNQMREPNIRVVIFV